MKRLDLRQTAGVSDVIQQLLVCLCIKQHVDMNARIYAAVSRHITIEIPIWLIAAGCLMMPASSNAETAEEVKLRRLIYKHTPNFPIKSFPIESPRVELSGRPPIKFYGHDNSHPLELRVCLSQTL